MDTKLTNEIWTLCVLRISLDSRGTYLHIQLLTVICPASARAKMDDTQSCREAMAQRIDLTLDCVSDSGDVNQVNFNASKTYA